jgi:hypothetical protein
MIVETAAFQDQNLSTTQKIPFTINNLQSSRQDSLLRRQSGIDHNSPQLVIEQMLTPSELVKPTLPVYERSFFDSHLRQHSAARCVDLFSASEFA